MKRLFRKVKLPLFWILVVCFFQRLCWMTAVPIFQTPDEQSHITQLQYSIAGEKINFLKMAALGYYYGQSPVNISKNNRSLEIGIVEKLLGTYRDSRGENKFTYHPEYRIPYTKGLFGVRENDIRKLSEESKTSFYGDESAYYPPLYYLIVSPFYKIAETQSIIERIFVVRIVSLLLGVSLVYIAFKIAKLITNSDFFSCAFALIVGFQPMLSYISSGVHPDNLFNFFSAVLIYVSLLLLKNGWSWILFIMGLAVIYLGLQTKVFAVFQIPVYLALCVYIFLRESKKALTLSLLILVTPAAAIWFRAPFGFIPQYKPASLLANWSILDYLKFRLPKTLFETYPWFWGVFKWLGVVLPIQLLRVITRVTFLAIIGLLIYMLRNAKNRKEYVYRATVFFIVMIVSFATYLFLLDFRNMQSIGFSYGIQGRYFFPVVIPVLFVLMLGLVSLVPNQWPKIQKALIILLVCGVVIINFIALSVLISSHYSAENSLDLINQISQYKPLILKGWPITSIVILFIISLTVSLLKFMFIKNDFRKK